MDAILLTPCDSVSASVSIEQIGGPGEVVSHIASDNVLGGRMAGELMAQLLGGQGNVAILTHPGVTSVIDRIRGFREVVSASEGLLVVGELPVWRFTRAKATELVRRLLTGAIVDGLFCINGELTLGAADVIEASGKVGVVVGLDGNREVGDRIQQGRIQGDVIQHPEAIGALALVAIGDHLVGRPVPPVICAESGWAPRVLLHRGRERVDTRLLRNATPRATWFRWTSETTSRRSASP